MGGDLDAKTFFDGAEGQAWLHRLVVVLLLVVVLHGGAGVERVQFILRCLHLDRRVACSRAHLQTRVRQMGATVRAFGVQETQALSATMPPRTVTLCPDETWLAGTMILVANDAVSGWLWVQTIATTRDRATWTQAVQDGTRGMALTLRDVTADGAAGLIAMAETDLGIAHHAELFHGQYELTRACSRRLAVGVATAEKAHQEAVAATQALRADRRAAARGERGPGRPPDWAYHLAVAEHAQHQTDAALRHARNDQATMGEVVRGLSEALHPVDLATGEPRDGGLVARSLEALVARARGVADRLGDRGIKAVAKVQRMVPSWASMVPAWWSAVTARVAAEGLAPGLTTLMLRVLIPAMYVAWVRERNHLTAATRTALGTVHERLLAQVRGDAAWQALPCATREHLLALACECARWFVRCTGSTEGHNGWLRLRFHQRHAVTPAWLDTQRVLHNFLIRRADGTTAAQRFFDAAHGDLVEYLVARMPLPALPRQRKAHPASPIERLNL
jgi:hypothetical protein